MPRIAVALLLVCACSLPLQSQPTPPYAPNAVATDVTRPAKAAAVTPTTALPAIRFPRSVVARDATPLAGGPMSPMEPMTQKEYEQFFRHLVVVITLVNNRAVMQDVETFVVVSLREPKIAEAYATLGEGFRILRKHGATRVTEECRRRGDKHAVTYLMTQYGDDRRLVEKFLVDVAVEQRRLAGILSR